jgi:hypothetical protein
MCPFLTRHAFDRGLLRNTFACFTQPRFFRNINWPFDLCPAFKLKRISIFVPSRFQVRVCNEGKLLPYKVLKPYVSSHY